MLTLAQLGAQLGTTVPQLPDPPIFTYYLLENPWPLTIAIAVGSTVAMIVLKHRGMAIQSQRVLIAGLSIAIVVAGLGATITTERETLRAQTRELVDLTAAADTGPLRDLLTDQARIGTFAPHLAAITGRDDILAAVRHYLGDMYPLESHTTGAVQAVLDGPDIARTQVRVWVKLRKDQQIYGGSIGAWFRLQWTRAPNTPGAPWKAAAIEVMQLDGAGQNPDIAR